MCLSLPLAVVVIGPVFPVPTPPTAQQAVSGTQPVTQRYELSRTSDQTRYATYKTTYNSKHNNQPSYGRTAANFSSLRNPTLMQSSHPRTSVKPHSMGPSSSSSSASPHSILNHQTLHPTSKTLKPNPPTPKTTIMAQDAPTKQ